MMDTQVDRELLEKIADLIGKPVGAFNIRKDCGCDGRVSTEHIKIDDRTDGHAGIDIRILDGTKGETCHIPVIITKSGVEETVYNDFYIGEDCDVEIVAGCGIHNCGDQESRHDGIHTFHVGKNSHVHYSEKHYAEGDGRGEKIMNPQTIVYLEEGASIQMDTVQIRGVDSTKRYTKIVCGKGAEAVITERLLTHGRQVADSDMVIELNGEDAKGRVCGPGRVLPGVPPLCGGQRQVLRPCAVRLHYYGTGQDQLRAGDRRQRHRGPADPRGRHRQDRRGPAAEAGDPGPHRGGSGGPDPQGIFGIKTDRGAAGRRAGRLFCFPAPREGAFFRRRRNLPPGWIQP